MTAINFATQKGQRTVARPRAKTVASSSNEETTSRQRQWRSENKLWRTEKSKTSVDHGCIHWYCTVHKIDNNSISLPKDTIDKLQFPVGSPVIVLNGEKVTILTVTVSDVGDDYVSVSTVQMYDIIQWPSWTGTSHYSYSQMSNRRFPKYMSKCQTNKLLA